MGSCQPTIQKESDQKAAYDQIIRCPRGHMLAYFQQSFCSRCQKKDRKSIKAEINCITCQYSLCMDCFEKNYQKWKKKTIQNRIQTLQLLRQKNTVSLDEYEAHRLKKFIIDKIEIDRHIRTEGCQVSLQESIDVRTSILKNYVLNK